VSSYVEVWGRSGRELRMLDSERVTLGTLETNDLVVDEDGVSRVHAGDEISLGRLRVRFHAPARGTETAAIAQPPPLTARERDVLVALCRPLLTGDAFTEPASIKAIAAELVVSEAAVKQHLSRLYDKFDVPSGDERRRVRLANAAVARGAVKPGDLRAGD
jgi:DNA-binding NarL/FixJ family response regulator